MINEVYPGIFVIEERGLFKTLKPPVNIYVIPGSQGIIYDAGYGNFCALRAFRREFADIRRYCREKGIESRVHMIMISHAHPDHFAGMKKLASFYKLKTVMTERMAEIIHDNKTYRKSYEYEGPGRPRKLLPLRILKGIISRINDFIYSISWGIDFVSRPDTIIGENSDIFINGDEWKIIHSPGHSDDHISLYNPQTGVLLGGDNILRSKFTWLGPPKSDIDIYIKSLETIRDLPGLKVILTSHGSIVTDPRLRINEIIGYWKNRMQQVEKCINKSGKRGVSLNEIILHIYPESGRMKHEFVRGWIMLVLEKMIRENVIYVKEGFYRTLK